MDGRSLNAWRLNLQRSNASNATEEVATKPRLVELVPAPPSRADARYVVHVDGARIDLVDDFREDTLVRLIRALRAC